MRGQEVERIGGTAGNNAALRNDGQSTMQFSVHGKRIKLTAPALITYDIYRSGPNLLITSL